MCMRMWCIDHRISICICICTCICAHTLTHTHTHTHKGRAITIAKTTNQLLITINLINNNKY